MNRLNDDARWLVNELAKNEAKIKALGKPQLASSSIEGGKIEEYDRDGSLSQIIGEQHDGTHTSATVGGPVPPEPVAPSVTVGFGSAEVRANGKFAGDALSPMDFSHFSVHASRVEVFSPDNESKRADIAGEAGDLAVILLDPGAWTFGLVAVSKAGKWSALSETVTVEVPDFPEVQDMQDALDDAFGQIGAVDSKATAAAGVASSAQSKADTAKSAADQAAADALAASGVAAGKGKVLVQSSAPVAADRNAVTLWIDTTGGANTPKRWTTGTTWVAVTDKAATDAATAAANAKTAADAAAAAAAAAQAAAGTAQSTADNALTMAGSATKAYYSTSTPSGVARTDRDIWRQINAAKDVIGEWFWDATLSTPGWVKTLVSSQSISNLDVGKLTVGTGIISDLVAEHIAGRSARFIQLDVSQLVAVTGTMSEAVITKLFTDVVMSRKITAQMLAVGDFENYIATGLGTNNEPYDWARGLTPDFVDVPAGLSHSFKSSVGEGTKQSTASMFDVNPGAEFIFEVWVKADKPNSRIFIEMRDQNGAHGVTSTRFENEDLFWGNASYPVNSAPVPTSWTKWRAKCVVKDGVRSLRIASIYFNHTAGTERNAQVWLAGLSFKRRFGGEAVIDGSLKARSIDVLDLAANTGFIADLTARIVKSDMFVGKEFIGGVFTGGTFQTSNLPTIGVKIDQAGFRAYSTDGEYPLVEMSATGDDAFGVNDPLTGDVLASLDREGGIAGQSLTITGEARVDGTLITGGEPLTAGHGSGDYGPTVNGRDIIGKTFLEYAESHPGLSDGNAWMTALPFGLVARGFRNIKNWSIAAEEREVLELSYENKAARAYRVHIAPIGIYAQPGTYIHLRVYRTTDGTRPTLDTPRFLEETVRTSGQAFSGNHHMHHLGGTFYDGNASGRVRYLISVEAIGGTATVYDGAFSGVMRCWIEDIGLVADDTGQDRSGKRANGSTAEAPTPPAPKPDPVKTYTTTVAATWWQAYLGTGVQATGTAYTGNAAQGRTPYYTANGVMRGLVGIPSQKPLLDGTGTTLKKVEVYVYAKAWHSGAGGTVCIGTHSNTSKPGTWSSTTNDLRRQKMKRGEGRWITLPASTHAGFKDGTLRGISFLPPGSSTSSEYYGIFIGNKTKFRFTYTR